MKRSVRRIMFWLLGLALAAGCFCLAFPLGFDVVRDWGAFYLRAYQPALAAVHESPAAVDALGTPITFG